ncbi:MAG TPA: hypothetical protein VK125_02965 [Bacillota bacterium]|nr:hypothetical protein [Bacillota bacterium]
MHTFVKFSMITFISGSILAGVLKIVQIFFHVPSYMLLFNMDYIPLLKQWNDVTGSGYVFHFLFCFISIVGLFYIAKIFHVERKPLLYVGVYTIGSGVLYFLTALTEQPPEATSFIAWLWWVIAHIIFGIVVGAFIKKWMNKR